MFQSTALDGVVVLETRLFRDERGFFFEGFNEKRFNENGISAHFVQDNFSRSSRGTLRGLHYQRPPFAQGKFVRVIRGKVLDVVVDIRQDSPTFGKHLAFELSDENGIAVYVPPGFAHGFLTLSETADFHYKVTNYYAPTHEGGILWNDDSLEIAWPEIPGTRIVISEKDAKLPKLKDQDPTHFRW